MSFEEFTERARKVMALANEEAERLGHEFIGTEHILLGLLGEGTGVGTTVLKNCNVDLEKVRNEVERLAPQQAGNPHARSRPQAPLATQAIQRAIEEAQRLGHNYVGTEHLLLGLAAVPEGVAAQVLSNLGVKLDDLRAETLQLLNPMAPAANVIQSFAHHTNSKDRQDAKMAEGFAGLFGPTQIDRTIRQAIQFCRLMLPKERRNPDEVERQIRRIVDRAFRDMHEDQEAFRPTPPPGKKRG